MMERFYPFQRLPRDIRKKIWTHAAYWPRVVGMTDVYGEANFEHPESDHRKTIVIASHTRTPAILGVCHESRSLALTIYVSLDNGNPIKNKQRRDRHTPVYVNPEVDIIYRNRLTCFRGGAFVLRYMNVGDDRDYDEVVLKKPVSGTRTLAVDIAALPKRYPPISLHDAELVFGQDHTQWPRAIASILAGTATSRIADCAVDGVRKILIVVGNDDRRSEVNLVPLNTDVERMTPREKGALDEASRIREELRFHWKRKLDDSDPKYTQQNMPSIQVVTVDRKSATIVPFFQRLPIELQDLIWEFAARTPRILTLEKQNIDDGYQVASTRPPALASVCKSSRRVLMNQTFGELPGSSMAYFQPLSDTVHLDCGHNGIYNDWRECSKLKIQSLGLDWDYARMFFTASDAKLFNGLQEIVIIVGGSSSEYERTLVAVEENLRPSRVIGDFKTYHQSLLYVQRLRSQLETVSKRWKSYQRRRAKQGKVSPNWIVPTVRLAHLEAFRQVKSPYHYEHVSRRCVLF